MPSWYSTPSIQTALAFLEHPPVPGLEAACSVDCWKARRFACRYRSSLTFCRALVFYARVRSCLSYGCFAGIRILNMDPVLRVLLREVRYSPEKKHKSGRTDFNIQMLNSYQSNLEQTIVSVSTEDKAFTKDGFPVSRLDDSSDKSTFNDSAGVAIVQGKITQTNEVAVDFHDRFDEGTCSSGRENCHRMV